MNNLKTTAVLCNNSADNQYPKPKIPPKQLLTAHSILPIKSKKFPSILNAGAVKYVTSGRMAIANALLQLKINKNHEILIPAYHCSSMVEPISWLGAKPIFYRIHSDTKVNMDSIKSLMSDKTSAIIVTHYFGFPQDIKKIRAFCDEHKIGLIEDCAHAFFGYQDGSPIGYYGDFAIASIMKFFPVYDGGCLVSSKLDMRNVKLLTSPLSFQMKSAINTIEQAFEYNRLKSVKPLVDIILQIKNKVWQYIKSVRKTTTHERVAPVASEGGYGFDPLWVRKRMSWFSRCILMTSNTNQIINRRRDIYQKLHEKLSHFPSAHPLFPHLPDNVVPHVYPLYVERLDAVFPILKNKGVPIFRFGEFLDKNVTSSTCSNSIDLSKHLLQLPIHQEMTDNELQWMISTTSECLSQEKISHA